MSIYVVEIAHPYGSKWLTHAWDRSLAVALMTQQAVEYIRGLPARVRYISLPEPLVSTMY